MTNYFALLGLPETLRLDTNSIEQSWRERCRTLGSEIEAGNGISADDPDLNRARAVLSDPTSRLEHWLELRNPTGAANRSLDPSLMDLFSELSPTIERTDALLSRFRKSTTSLARAVLTREAIEAQLKIQQFLHRIQSLKSQITDQFESYEAKAAEGDFDTAAFSLGQLKFLKRWEEQCRERLLSLISC